LVQAYFKNFFGDKEKILTILVYFALFLYLIFPYSDKDWGWHLKYGEYLLKTGKILTSDIFSWTMPGYQWANHSWAYDPLMYFLYKNTGFIGLSVAGAIVGLLTFYIIVKQFNLSWLKIAIIGFFFLRLSEGGLNEGLRSQVVGGLFFSALMVIFIKYRQNPKIIYFLPLLFLLWANFHGTFLLGLLITGIFLTYYFFSEKKLSFVLPLVFLISFLATFINPFFHKIYLEGIRHFSNPYLKEISEWQPSVLSCDYCNVPTVFIYLILLANFLFKKRKLEHIPHVAVILILTYLGFSSRRYLSILAIVTLPVASEIIQNLNFKPEKFRSYLFLSFLAILVLIEFNLFSRLPGFNFYKYNEYNYCFYSSGCSSPVAEYLKKHPPKGNGFNFYNTGGYYIGKDIPAKLFIDGRMHLWEKDGYMPFAEYSQIFYSRNYDTWKKYNIKWALIPVNSDLGIILLNTKKLEAWSLEYQDNNNGYFVRK